ncbi:MAG: twin-arginine translocase subunit TatC [Candidatus Bathyarchaeia archaeon]|nr:preprotein translocase subunit TatC [Candidatus Bathyarchaeota archaeon]
MTSNPNSAKDNSMTFWEHINELSRRLKIPLYVLIITTIVATVFPASFSFSDNPTTYEPLIALILRIIRERVLPSDVKLIGFEFVAPIELYLVSSFFLGLAAMAPVLAYEIFKFVSPGLYPHERRELLHFMTFFSILFIGGILAGFFIIVPFGISALLPFFRLAGAEPLISVTSFYYFVFFLTLATGALFTFPVFLALLVKLGITRTDSFKKNRKYIYVALLALVFIITPGEGGLANLALFSIIILLFEAGIFFASRYEKKVEPIKTPKCKYCGESMSARLIFCPKCGRSQK